MELFQAFELCKKQRIKTQILTLSPEKYSHKSISEFFGISIYQVNLAIKQRNFNGIGQLQEKKIIFRDKLSKSSIEIF